MAGRGVEVGGLERESVQTLHKLRHNSSSEGFEGIWIGAASCGMTAQVCSLWGGSPRNVGLRSLLDVLHHLQKLVKINLSVFVCVRLAEHFINVFLDDRLPSEMKNVSKFLPVDETVAILVEDAEAL